MKNNWEETTLNDISILITKGTTPTTVGFLFEKQGIHFIKIESIDDKGNILLDKIKYISKECHNYLKRSQLQENDVLCSIAGAIGRISIVSKEILPANTNQALAIIRLKNGVYNKYIKYFLISDLALEQFKKQQKGVAQLNLTLKNISDLKIKLPPLQKQKQIVEKLDKKFANIDKLTDIVKQNLENSKELFNSYLNKLFTENNNNWEETTLNDVCKKIFAGGDKPVNFSKIENKKYSIPVIANGITNDGLLGFTDVATVTEKAVTVSARGTIGFVCKRYKPFCPIVRLIVVIPKQEKTTLEFLYYLLQTLIPKSNGSSIPQLTVPNFKYSKIKLPPLQQQKQIVKILDNLQEQTKKLEEIYNKKIELAKELKQSILHKELSND